MKEIYIKKLLLFCCFIVFASFTALGQYDLVISKSESVKDTYDLTIGVGAYPEAGKPYELFYQTGLACDTMASAEAANKIALIDRGTCSFVIKIEAAKKAGAAAVIICNNSAATPININATSSLSAAGTFVTNRPTIPVFMASQADCAKIKADLSGGTLSGSFEITGCDTEVEYEPEIFWGHIPGQGDFSNGLGEWTVKGISAPEDTFKVLPSGIPESGRFNGNNYLFASPTYCNGVASISFVTNNLLKNPTLAQPYYNTTSELISPTIDCTGKESVSVTFYTLDARLNGEISISYSIDDGETWSEPEAFETVNAVNGASKVVEQQLFPLVAFANQPKCKIKFVADGDFYYFMVDDVTFTNKKVFDMTINKDYFSGGLNYATPFNQVEEIPFTLDIENIGNVPAENVKVVLDIYNSTPDTALLVHTDTLNYGTVNVGVRDADRIFTKKFTPPSEEAYYVGVYTLLADSMQVNDNRQVAFDFEYTNNLFSKMPDDIDILNAWGSTDDTYVSAANLYQVKTGQWPNGQGIVLDKGRGGATIVTNGVSSAIVSYDVYKWEDMNQDTFIVQGNERTLLATGSTIIDGSVDSITIDLYDPLDPSKKVVLPNEDMNLLGVFSVSPLDATGLRVYMNSVNPFQGDNDGLYHGYASALGKLNSGGTSIWTGSFEGNGTGDDLLTRDFVQTSLTYYAPLYFSAFDPVSNKELNTSLKINAYPVPAVTNMNVDLSFDKSQEYTNVVITDMSGRIVHLERFVNIQSKNLNIDVSRFAAGVYNLRVVTENGFNSQNFSVVK